MTNVLKYIKKNARMILSFGILKNKITKGEWNNENKEE